MSGYTPVFGEQVFSGSLCGKFPDSAAWLFMLSLADRHGVVDKTPQYISSITGMPIELLQPCLDRFQQPDPMSRTQEHEGRRLVLLDPARPWGWRVVNFQKYREKARLLAKDSARTASGLDAQRKAAARAGSCPPLSPGVPLSDGNGNEDRDEEGERQFPVPETSSKPERVEAQQAAPNSAGNLSTKKPGNNSRGTRLPVGFKLTPARQQYAEQNGIQNAGKVFEKFRNHWTAAPGVKGVKLDWDATWRNWVLTESERPPSSTKFDRIHGQTSNVPPELRGNLARTPGAKEFRCRTDEEVEAEERARETRDRRNGVPEEFVGMKWS